MRLRPYGFLAITLRTEKSASQAVLCAVLEEPKEPLMTRLLVTPITSLTDF
jgi:hypothetical protein